MTWVLLPFISIHSFTSVIEQLTQQISNHFGLVPPPPPAHPPWLGRGDRGSRYTARAAAGTERRSRRARQTATELWVFAHEF